MRWQILRAGSASRKRSRGRRGTVDGRDTGDTRASILSASLAVGVTTGAYGLSFGALSSAAGLTLPETAALSLLMFTGASQFAFVSAIGGGASPVAAAAVAALLGVRNALYGLRLSPLLAASLRRRLVAAHLVIDESAAMAVARTSEPDARLAFWSTGIAIFVLWNLATLVGALGARALPDPKAVGLDAAAPAAFLALVAPRLVTRRQRLVAGLAAAVALAAVPVTPTGAPVFVAAAVAIAVACVPARSEPGLEPGFEPGSEAPSRRDG